ncbi:MAG: VWA domain-containing protein, partial [Terriglobales bacterium]
DISKLKEALERVVTRGGTALYDAVVASADHLKKNTRLNKRVLLVVTDGEDNASSYSLEQAIRKVQDNEGPTVYTIGILDRDTRKRAKRALRAFAGQTGGLAFFPDNIEEVDSITRTVARDIRNQYTIGYKPSNPGRHAGYRTIRVDARANGYKRLDVRTRSGYYVAEERAAKDEGTAR